MGAALVCCGATQREQGYKQIGLQPREQTDGHSERREKTDGHSEEDEQLRRAVAGKLLNANVLVSHAVVSKLDKLSVYGQAVAMPQIARSAGWPIGMNLMVFRSIMFLIINVWIQIVLLMMIVKEEVVMDGFAAQVHLCDFGAFIGVEPDCEDGSSCRGPAGTNYTLERLYSWDQWVARDYVKQSLIAIFPEKKVEIEERIDPGEYGIEDYWCRLCAVSVFMIAMMEEVLKFLRFAKLIYVIPTKAEDWLRYEGPLTAAGEPSEDAELKLEIKGMSLGWKLFTCLFVLLPRFAILKLTLETGTIFLMDTAGIEDVIVNCVALSFLLSLDDMIFELLNDRATKSIMRELADYEGAECVTKINLEHLKEAQHPWVIAIKRLVPFQLGLLMFMILFNVWIYYSTHCKSSKNGGMLGGMVSKDISIPTVSSPGPLYAFFPRLFPVPVQSEPAWSWSEE